MRSMRWVYGLVLVLVAASLPGSPVASAEPIIPSPSRIVLSAPATTVVVTSGTIVPPARMIEEMGSRCTPGGGTPNSYSMFDKEGVIAGECEFDLGDDSFQRQFGTGFLNGNVDLVTGAFDFQQTSKVTYSFLGTSNTYDITITGSASLPGGYFPIEGTGEFTFARACAGPGCAEGDSSYSYAGTIGFEFDLFPIEDVDLILDWLIAVQVVESSEPFEGHQEKVADKETIVRVFVTADRAVGGVTVELTAKRGGVPLAALPTLIIGSATSSIVAPDPNLKWHSFNFRLPASWTTEGALEIEARVKPPLGVVDPDPDNNGGFLTPYFATRHRLSITYLPVCVAGDFGTYCPSEGMAQGATVLNTIFPLPDVGAIYEKAALPPWIWDEFPVDDQKSARLLAALQKRYDLTTLLGLIAGPDQIAAWLPAFQGKYLGIAHASFNGGRSRVSYSQFLPADPALSYKVFAHEIAHNLGARHPSTADSCNSKDSGTDWRTPGDKTTSTLDAQGWDVPLERVVKNTAKDLMSYCFSNHWISEFTYDKLFSALTPFNSFAARAPATYFVVSGSAKADGSGGSLGAG